MHASFRLYARAPTAQILRNFGELNVQWLPVGAHASIQSQKETAKFHRACIFHTIRSISQLFLLDIAPINLLTVNAP